MFLQVNMFTNSMVHLPTMKIPVLCIKIAVKLPLVGHKVQPLIFFHITLSPCYQFMKILTYQNTVYSAQSIHPQCRVHVGHPLQILDQWKSTNSLSLHKYSLHICTQLTSILYYTCMTHSGVECDKLSKYVSQKSGVHLLRNMRFTPCSKTWPSLSGENSKLEGYTTMIISPCTMLLTFISIISLSANRSPYTLRSFLTQISL